MALQPSLRITHVRRRPQDQAYEWAVDGACTPPPFSTLNDARLFVEREGLKYTNGRMLPFKPTHMIMWQPVQSPTIKRRIPVKMVATAQRVQPTPVALYTESEWEPCTIPQWNYWPPTSRLILDGVVMRTTWWLVPYEQGIGIFGYLIHRSPPDRMRADVFVMGLPVFGYMIAREATDTVSAQVYVPIAGQLDATEFMADQMDIW